MLLNISQDFSSSKELIDGAVGGPYDLEQRKKYEGISYSGLPISAASLEIYNLLVLNEEKSNCSIEMRPNGIIMSFRSRKDTYALVIPHHKLRIYKGKAEEYSFYKDHHFIKIWAGKDESEVHGFIRKVRSSQSDNSPPRIEDL